MWQVYLIQNNITKEIYVGYTNNLQRRLLEHNDFGKKQRFTYSKQGKWIIIYFECFRNKNDAIMRERKLKLHGRGIQELKKRLENSFL